MSQLELNSIDEINTLVYRYQEGDKTAVTELIDCFSPLINKYVCILKGRYTRHAHDTIAFLSLFLPGEAKTSKNLDRVLYNLKRLTVGWEDEDLQQQITLFILEILQKFQNRQNINFVGYLTRGLRWRLKDWIFHGMSLMDQANDQVTYLADSPWARYVPVPDVDSHETIDVGKLDLNWICNCKDPLFKNLTIYERNLLYHHAHDLGVESIGNLLYRAKDTVHSHLKAILQKIKKNITEDD